MSKASAKPSKPPCGPSPTPTIEAWSIDRPIPYARNPRRIDERAVAAVAGSIKEFGFKSPIIVDIEGVVINGHTRLQAAMRLGLTEVPVIVASDLTPAQVQAYRLADNRVAEFSEWDADLLAIELGECDIEMDWAGFDALMKDGISSASLLDEPDEQAWADEQDRENGSTTLMVSITCPAEKLDEVKILATSLATHDIKVFFK